MPENQKAMSNEATPPAPELELIGTVAAAKMLGISDEALRLRLKKCPAGALQPIGRMSSPARLMFSRADVEKEVQRLAAFDR